METPATAAGFLQACSEGRIGSREAIHGEPAPDRGREKQVEREVPGSGPGQAALPMLAEALGVPLPLPLGYRHPQNDKDRC